MQKYLIKNKLAENSTNILEIGMTILMPHTAEQHAFNNKGGAYFEQDYPENYVSGIVYFAIGIISVSLLVSFLACKFLVPTSRYVYFRKRH